MLWDTVNKIGVANSEFFSIPSMSSKVFLCALERDGKKWEGKTVKKGRRNKGKVQLFCYVLGLSTLLFLQ